MKISFVVCMLLAFVSWYSRYRPLWSGDLDPDSTLYIILANSNQLADLVSTIVTWLVIWLIIAGLIRLFRGKKEEVSEDTTSH